MVFDSDPYPDSPTPSPRLLAFLEQDAHPEPASAPALAEREFYTEGRGKTTPRLLRAGGVTYVRSTNLTLTREDLPPLTRRRADLEQLRIELIKFEFTFRELPENRRYKEIRVLITLAPHVPVMFLRPRAKSADSESVRTFSSQFAPTLAKLLQLEVSLAKTGSVSRTEQRPVVSCLPLGPEGFQWIYQAQEGAPLLPGDRQTIAVLELPADAKRIQGTFDAEAIVSRELLGKPVATKALPQGPAAPILVELTTEPGPLVPNSGR